MKNILFIPILFILFTSCIQEFDLKLNESDKLLVVDGLITNGKGPYFVRLTRSSNNLNNVSIPQNGDVGSIYNDKAEPIKDAVVIISDNLDNKDTLIPVPQYFGSFIKQYDGTGHVIDSVYNPNCEEKYNVNKGYYRTTRIRGVAGRYYGLKVLVDGKEYHSQCYMSPLPKIDSLSYTVKVSETKGEKYYSPLIYFNKPSELSYYLFRLNANSYLNQPDKTISPTINSIEVWDISIISTKLLKSYVNGLDIHNGTSVKSFLPTHYFPGDVIVLTMNSLTEKNYSFYNNLISQYNNDGGAFKPTPSSPIGNISNGALGFFGASATIELRKKITF